MNDLSSIPQHLLEFSPDALIVVDEQERIRFANETVRSLFGYEPADLIGRHLEVLVPKRFRIRHGAHVAAFARNPANREMGARIADLFARRADGSEFPAGIRLAPFISGEHRYVAAAIRDMTERRAISDALVAARDEADRANRAKTRFLATASHDLRQPLQTIRLLNASLQRLASADKLAVAASEIGDLLHRQEQAIDGATRLLNALLDINRMESGAVEPQLGEVNLGELLQGLRQEFAPAAEAKGLRLECSTTGPVLKTDRTLLTQILQNLIGNALKYTERGTVSIGQFLDADALTIKVEDTGIGIPAEKLDRIFDEYYQVDSQGHPRLGVGLGLAIVREAARLLGFSVAVSSTPGRGTRARVRIPRHTLVEKHNAPARELDQPAALAGAEARGRVLLLEDNDSVRAATELFLSLEGYEVHSAATLAEAESLLAAVQPGDVLVTDYHLDGSLTGLDLLQQVRARQSRDVPAVLLSGDLQSMRRLVKREIPNCRFLSKPVDTKTLVAAIAELRQTWHFDT